MNIVGYMCSAEVRCKCPYNGSVDLTTVFIFFRTVLVGFTDVQEDLVCCAELDFENKNNPMPIFCKILQKMCFKSNGPRVRFGQYI